jgi:hypothetical protein
LRTIQTTNRGAVLVDDEDFERFGHFNWQINQRGYVHRSIRKGEPGGRFGTVQTLHREILKAPPGFEVDHMNGDTTDNRRCNLRLCSRSGNLCNKRKHKGLSRFKGVSFQKDRGKWRATICIPTLGKGRGKVTTIGRFEREEDAARAYDKAALEHHGEFARTNEMLGLYAQVA